MPGVIVYLECRWWRDQSPVPRIGHATGIHRDATWLGCVSAAKESDVVVQEVLVVRRLVWNAMEMLRERKMAIIWSAIEACPGCT